MVSSAGLDCNGWRLGCRGKVIMSYLGKVEMSY
jgi:hypothetical protein